VKAMRVSCSNTEATDHPAYICRQRFCSDYKSAFMSGAYNKQVVARRGIA
jgi:hypothetical protein